LVGTATETSRGYLFHHAFHNRPFTEDSRIVVEEPFGPSFLCSNSPTKKMYLIARTHCARLASPIRAPLPNQNPGGSMLTQGQLIVRCISWTASVLALAHTAADAYVWSWLRPVSTSPHSRQSTIRLHAMSDMAVIRSIWLPMSHLISQSALLRDLAQVVFLSLRDYEG
jgi:hypothetical protein